MVMVDCLVNSTEKVYNTTFEVRPDNIFVENGRLLEPGLVENIAQTAAAGVGYQAKQANLPVPVGFIGAIKNLELYFLPVIGEELKTTVTLTNQIFDIRFIEGIVEIKDKVAARCEMKIFLNQSK